MMAATNEGKKGGYEEGREAIFRLLEIASEKEDAGE